jgi:hypothetical protein
MDVIVKESFNNLQLNYAGAPGAESKDFVAAGVLNFDQIGFGHVIADGRTPKQPVSKRPVMKFKKPYLASANTHETKTASFKTAKIHNTYIQNAQCQKAQFFCIATSF